METNHHYFSDLVWSWINALMITTSSSISELYTKKIIGSKKGKARTAMPKSKTVRLKIKKPRLPK
jgi:hypothetical protein